MTRFRFPLERVLEWRRTQLEVEEAKFRRSAAAVAAVDQARAELAAGAVHTEVEVRGWERVEGSDLEALGRYRERVRAEEGRLAARRAECVRALAERERSMLEARRRYRLLERLKERRLAEWKAAGEREMDAVAAEAYLSQWGRTGRPAL